MLFSLLAATAAKSSETKLMEAQVVFLLSFMEEATSILTISQDGNAPDLFVNA